VRACVCVDGPEGSESLSRFNQEKRRGGGGLDRSITHVTKSRSIFSFHVSPDLALARRLAAEAEGEDKAAADAGM
jgi:hypothetical protein